MSGDVSMVFFRRESYDLDAAERDLAERGLSVVREADGLTVWWHTSPKLRIRLSSAAYVQQEAVEISASSPNALALAQCDTRFEITFDDLAEVLDEINTLIEVQITLQQATQGFLFNTWNGNLSLPDE